MAATKPNAPMPAGLRRRAAQAKEQLRGQFAPPGFAVAAEGSEWAFACPYTEEDRDNWEALLFAAFGSCSQSVVTVFLRQLSKLVGAGWDEGASEWRPHLDELNSVIAIVASLKPANEAQAALAAQFVACHLTTMKLADNCANMTYPDERTAATLARLAKASASIARTIAGLQGARTTRHETHVHYHNHDERHLHMTGGAGNIGGQPHGTNTDAGQLAELSALPSQDETRRLLPSSSNAGQAGVRKSWRERWRSLWRG